MAYVFLSVSVSASVGIMGTGPPPPSPSYAPRPPHKTSKHTHLQASTLFVVSYVHPSSDKENIRFITFLLDEARRLLGEMVRRYVCACGLGWMDGWMDVCVCVNPRRLLLGEMVRVLVGCACVCVCMCQSAAASMTSTPTCAFCPLATPISPSSAPIFRC